MPLIAWLLVVLLMVLHQDWWLWDNNTLLFGFMPVGLAWHIGISIAASLLWAHICFWHWPKELDEIESMADEKAVDTSAVGTRR